MLVFLVYFFLIPSSIITVHLVNVLYMCVVCRLYILWTVVRYVEVSCVALVLCLGVHLRQKVWNHLRNLHRWTEIQSCVDI